VCALPWTARRVLFFLRLLDLISGPQFLPCTFIGQTARSAETARRRQSPRGTRLGSRHGCRHVPSFGTCPAGEEPAFPGYLPFSTNDRPTAFMSQDAHGESRRIYELAALGRDAIHAEIERLRASTWTLSAVAMDALSKQTLATYRQDMKKFWGVGTHPALSCSPP
jgi:hypothetical protein